MGHNTDFDFYGGGERDQVSFYRIPKELVRYGPAVFMPFNGRIKPCPAPTARPGGSAARW